jgi:hypothetical protein
MSRVVSSIETRKTSNKQTNRVKKDDYEFQKLSNLRIIQRQLVYVIGLSHSLAFKDVKYSLN